MNRSLTSLAVSAILATAAHAQSILPPVAQMTVPICYGGGSSWYPCAPGTVLTAGSPAALTALLPAEQLPNYGRNAAEVDAQFAPAIVNHFGSNPNLDAMIAGLSAPMLARLSLLLTASDPSGDSSWMVLYYTVKHGSAASLVKLQSAFGSNWLNEILLAYGTPAQIANYYGLPLLPVLTGSSYYYALGGTWQPMATQTNYPNELFLEYYTQGAGGTSYVALARAQRYAQVKGFDFFKAVQIGAIVFEVVRAFDPDLPNQIADAVTYGSTLPSNISNGWNFQPTVVSVGSMDIDLSVSQVNPDEPVLPPIEGNLDSILWGMPEGPGTGEW